MKNTRNIHKLARQAGLITALALSGFLLAVTTRGNAAPFGTVELLQDGDFEGQAGAYLSTPWTWEYAGPYGGSSNFQIQSGQGTSCSGVKNVKIVPSFRDLRWYGISQRVTAVSTVRRYRLTGWVRCSTGVQTGYLGVRDSNGNVIKQTVFGTASTQYKRLTVSFYTPANAGGVTVFVRFCTSLLAAGTYVQVDGLSLTQIDPFNPDLVDDSGFENQLRTTLAAAWKAEGTGTNGIDTGTSASGAKNAYIRATSGWNAVTQPIATAVNKYYVARAKVYTSPNFPAGFLGIRDAYGKLVAARIFGPSSMGYTEVTTAPFLGTLADPIEGSAQMLTLFVGYTATGSDSWVRIDDVHVWNPYLAVDP